MSHAEKETFALSPSTTVRAEPVEACPELDRWDHTALRTGLSKCVVHEQRPAGTQRGYALLLMLVLVTMGILFTLVSQLSVVSMKWSRAQGGSAALLQAKEALIGYAATYRDTHSGEVFGYLPCPDADGDGNAETTNNSTNCASSNQVVVGLLPYQTLGLSDLRDASGECLWYAVSPNYKAGLNKVEPMNWDSRGQIRILDSDGVTMLADPVNGTEGGAVAVIFAAGPPLSNNTTGRGNDSSKTCDNSGKANWSAFLESAVFDASGNSTDNPLIVTRGTIDGVTNNDQIAWITPKEIWNRFRQRSDKGSINDLTTAVKTALQSSIVSNLNGATGPSPSPSKPPQLATSYTTVYSGMVGKLPDVSASLDSSLTSYFSNWQEQYYYVVCSNLCGYCLNIGGKQCDGAIFFGGTDTTGNPRAAGARSITDLFEDAAPLLQAHTNIFGTTGSASTYAGGSADVGVCVASKLDTLEAALTHCVLPDAAATSSFTGAVSTGPSAVAIDSTNHTITLGASGGNTTSGCVWTANTFAFGGGLRVYFKVNMTAYNASGITFAIIDSAQNVATPCGDEGGLLGYSTNSSFYSSDSVKPPKIGLEFDTVNSYPSYGDPQFGPDKHAALVYWGGSPPYDDNTHGATASSGFHSNPSTSSSGFSGDLSGLFAAGLFHVRMDIARSYNSSTSQGTYSIKVWMVSDASAMPQQRIDMRTITQDFTTTASGTLQTTVSDGTFTLNNYVSGAETLKNIRLGFTTGQIDTSGSQAIVISDLLAFVLP